VIIEKKLVAFSVIALLIGVSSVVPMMFLMSGTVKAETGPEPWFSVDIPYSYWVTSNGPLDYSHTTIPSSMVDSNSVSVRSLVALNVTLTADPAEKHVDAQVEYYQIDVSSDKEHIETIAFVVGTNSERSFNVSNLLSSFQFTRNDWFDTANFDPMKYGGGGGLAIQNWTSGTSIFFPAGSSGTGTIGGSSTYREVTALRGAETLIISVYRIGFATLSDNSTEVTLTNNQLINQIQLEKYGEEGWLYNNLIPQDELATVNLLRPVPFEELNEAQLP
jgi:hypothetical protein